MNHLLIVELRMQGISQTKLVRMAKLASETRLSRIIHGYISPSVEEVYRICAVLKKDPNELGFEVRDGA